jgi:hypothetical protein
MFRIAIATTLVLLTACSLGNPLGAECLIRESAIGVLAGTIAAIIRLIAKTESSYKQCNDGKFYHSDAAVHSVWEEIKIGLISGYLIGILFAVIHAVTA